MTMLLDITDTSMTHEASDVLGPIVDDTHTPCLHMYMYVMGVFPLHTSAFDVAYTSIRVGN